MVRGGRAGATNAFFILLLPLTAAPRAAQPDPLPAWHDGAAKSAIIEFVQTVTEAGSADFVAVPERIAVFDNDGTLWVEQPHYTQLAFAADRIRALAPEHPEWRTHDPYATLLAGDLAKVAGLGEQAIVALVMASHAGMTTDAFARDVAEWMAKARHPRFQRPYGELAYLPMQEVLAYLRANGFKTFIVSGGGADFMRPWTEAVYGIPPEQVVGSSIKAVYEQRDGVPVIVKLPEIDCIDDRAGKPLGIHRFIGRRSVAAFGNSDGDLEMLQWTTGGPGRRLGVIVHHDDADREYAYDRQSSVGRLDRALDQAPGAGWAIVSMKADWRQMFHGVAE